MNENIITSLDMVVSRLSYLETGLALIAMGARQTLQYIDNGDPEQAKQYLSNCIEEIEKVYQETKASLEQTQRDAVRDNPILVKGYFST